MILLTFRYVFLRGRKRMQLPVAYWGLCKTACPWECVPQQTSSITWVTAEKRLRTFHPFASGRTQWIHYVQKDIDLCKVLQREISHPIRCQTTLGVRKFFLLFNFNKPILFVFLATERKQPSSSVPWLFRSLCSVLTLLKWPWSFFSLG